MGVPVFSEFDFGDISPRTAIHRAAIENATATFTRRVLGVGAIAPFTADGWLKQARPDHDWSARHFVFMQRKLAQLTAGEFKRLYFSVPIRHGKTEHNSVSYAAYRLELDPSFKWIVGAYNQSFAEKISRAIRKLARSRGVQISRDRDTAREWETTAGGGVRALGAGTGSAGLNADGIIVDDPIGKREDAESQAVRDQVWDWLTDDILGRSEPHTIVLLTMSRWHADDPAGRLLDRQRGSWHVVDLPGEAEANDPLGRRLNEPLWPEHRGEEWLNQKRIDFGEYGFASLIQGRPQPRGGGMFKWEWWKLIDAVPEMTPIIRYWDLAGTKKKEEKDTHDPDWTAGVAMTRMIDGRTAIVNAKRFRLAVHERDAEIEKTARDDIAKYGQRISWWFETEAGIAGEDRTNDLVRRCQNVGLPVYTEHPTGNKVLRWEPLASKAGAGNVVLCPETDAEPWRDDFRLECSAAPNGKHDDQLDAAAGADAKLAAPVPTVGFQQVKM
jgi:predicted phage terminase large subunit-like protein